ncbi:MAG: BLUF domain-containing protein [Bacteroidota bacterium]|nr:BLUF domain-containing protein [Bacteroidota bacterium]
MLKPLHHLVYQSVATTFLDEPELKQVLTQSRAWNSTHGLTGVLLFSAGNIMQVLEGSPEEVQYIFDRIARDARHANLVKLADGPIAQRQFDQWAMGFKAVQPGAYAQLQGYIDPRRALPQGTAGTAIGLREVLAAFVSEDAIRF